MGGWTRQGVNTEYRPGCDGYTHPFTFIEPTGLCAGSATIRAVSIGNNGEETYSDPISVSWGTYQTNSLELSISPASPSCHQWYEVTPSFDWALGDTARLESSHDLGTTWQDEGTARNHVPRSFQASCCLDSWRYRLVTLDGCNDEHIWPSVEVVWGTTHLLGTSLVAPSFVRSPNSYEVGALGGADYFGYWLQHSDDGGATWTIDRNGNPNTFFTYQTVGPCGSRDHRLIILDGCYQPDIVMSTTVRWNGNCTPDFNGDGDLGTDADIEAFFGCVGGDCCSTCGSADFNGDGDVGTDADIDSFFRVLAGGPC